MTLLRETIFTSRLAAPLALAALPALFFWRLTFLGETLYWGTPLLQFYPWRSFAVQEYLSGQIPLWNPHVGLGAPLAANLQSAVFYPMNLIYLLIPIERAMTVTVVGHIALAGLFCYGFARLLGFSKAGAFVTGLTFMFSGYVVARAGFLSMTSVVAWLPALLWSVEGLLRALSDGRRSSVARWLCGLAAVTAMTLLAGHAQLAAYSLAAVSAYLLARSWSRWGQMATAGAGLALGAALAAVQLLPTLELARYSERQSGVAYDVATSSSLWPGQLLGLLFPNFFGSQAAGDWWRPGPFWDGAVYVGVLPLLLACYGLRFAPRGQAWFFGGLALLGAFLALGRFNPVFPFFFDNVSGMNLFQGPGPLLALVHPGRGHPSRLWLGGPQDAPQSRQLACGPCCGGGRPRRHRRGRRRKLRTAAQHCIWRSGYGRRLAPGSRSPPQRAASALPPSLVRVRAHAYPRRPLHVRNAPKHNYKRAAL